jgi:PAS domain S-box-containing protein
MGSEEHGHDAAADAQRIAQAEARVRALLTWFDAAHPPPATLPLEASLDRLEALAERAQAAARQRSLFINLVENAPNAVVLVDRTEHFTYANARYVTLHGRAAAEIVGKTLEEVIGHEHYQMAAAQLTRVFQGEILDFTTWYDYPDGPRYMHVYYFPLREDGVVTTAGVILTDITPLARTEEALRDSEERYYALSEATTEGIVIHENGIILEANQALADHLGFSPDELKGMPVLALTAPESHAEMISHMQAGDPGPYTAISLHRDGSRTIGEIRARNFVYKGRPVRLVAIREITELVRAREALEHSLHDAEAWAARLDAIISAIADVVTVVDMDGQILSMNPAAMALTTPETAPLLHTLRDILTQFQVTTPEGEPFTAEAPEIARVAHGDTVHGYHIVTHLPDGRVLWFSASAGPIRLHDGRQIGMVFTAADVTALHEAQEAAQRTLAELDATIASIADGLVIYDVNGTVKRVNQAMHAIARIPADMALRDVDMLQMLRIQTPDGHPLTHAQLPHVRALHGELVVGELLVVQPPGGTYWISASAAPIRTPRGEVLGAVLTISNVTQMRELQEEREAYIHTISHDLRAPLAIISGHAQLLRDTLEEQALDGELRPGVEAILRSVQRMTTMIRDMVDAARLAGGQLQLQVQSIDLAAYLSDFLARAESILPVARVQLDLPQRLPAVLADYDRLERIITNLLSNALKYSPPEHPVLLRARREGAMVIVSVQDFGQGIAVEALPHLFDRFFRAEHERVEGVGLGLYITKMLVEAHGGEIRVASTPGEGSTFTFTLPVAGVE